MKRLIDFFLSLILLLILLLPMLLVALILKLSSKGPVIYWSDRIGKDELIFKMPKFRTMKLGTPSVPTHLMSKPEEYLFPFGSFLRHYSIDEFPQLFSILKGNMSFVGPRPALSSQYDLISLRKDSGITELLPGLTGWAQINGRDNLSIKEKVDLDYEYLKYQSLWFDFKILWITFIRVFRSDGITH